MQVRLTTTSLLPEEVWFIIQSTIHDDNYACYSVEIINEYELIFPESIRIAVGVNYLTAKTLFNLSNDTLNFKIILEVIRVWTKNKT